MLYIHSIANSNNIQVPSFDTVITSNMYIIKSYKDMFFC
ncbi:hypothetical protein F7308_0893 [Francisella salina]|uniref:Uncharacterized protein n=1 Tax=Francisella salina TaxID=573569 RepID=A0ABM5M9C6_FRAST|nr:hypothetical protein F7308_0893 [Francisella salina]